MLILVELKGIVKVLTICINMLYSIVTLREGLKMKHDHILFIEMAIAIATCLIVNLMGLGSVALLVSLVSFFLLGILVESYIAFKSSDLGYLIIPLFLATLLITTMVGYYRLDIMKQEFLTIIDIGIILTFFASGMIAVIVLEKRKTSIFLASSETKKSGT